MDNHHVQISSSQASCAILQLSGYSSDTRKVLYALANYLYHPSRGIPAAFVLWSDVVEEDESPKKGNVRSNGGALWVAINKEFGGIIGTNVVENPKTSNPIQVWVWTIPHEQFKEWYRNERVRRAKAV